MIWKSELHVANVLVKEARKAGRPVVLTNGCFDLLHRGHVALLRHAKFGIYPFPETFVLVALNTDKSVTRLKGEGRPILPVGERRFILIELRSVDFIVEFDTEDDLCYLITELKPDILLKGGDWTNYITGASIVEGYGGQVLRFPYLPNRSTSNIIAKIRG